MRTRTMPPVANPVDTWDAAIEEALKANEGTGKPASLRQLHKRLAGLPASNQTEESWKKTVRLIRAKGRPSERNAKLLAQALGVPRPSLPPSAEPLTLAHLDARLQALEAEAVRARDVPEFVQPLQAAIRAVATGNTQEALRVLSDMAGL